MPYGVNVLWDGRASIDLAVATGAKFVREIFTGVYASDFGLWDTNVGEVARHRARVGGADVKLFFNIVPESATYLADRDLAVDHAHHRFRDAARRDLRVRCDRGAPTDAEALRVVKSAAGAVPVFVNTGVRAENVGDPARDRRRRDRRHLFQAGRRLREPGAARRVEESWARHERSASSLA